MIKHLIEATPSHPSPDLPAHQAAAQAFLRQGYQLALENLLVLPSVIDENEASEQVPILDPRD